VSHDGVKINVHLLTDSTAMHMVANHL